MEKKKPAKTDEYKKLYIQKVSGVRERTVEFHYDDAPEKAKSDRKIRADVSHGWVVWGGMDYKGHKGTFMEIFCILTERDSKLLHALVKMNLNTKNRWVILYVTHIPNIYIFKFVYVGGGAMTQGLVIVTHWRHGFSATSVGVGVKGWGLGSTFLAESGVQAQ